MSTTNLGGKLLQGYYADADRIAANQVADPASIDTALRLGAGFPVGPFEARGLPSDAAGQARHNGPIWKRIVVLGSGRMACGIAETVVRSGSPVTLTARSEASAERAVKTFSGAFQRSVDRGRITEADASAALELFDVRADGVVPASADLVIEAVAEDLRIKQEIFRSLDEILEDKAVIATNTSSFRVAEAAAETDLCRATLALHFFNPAPAMKLVEVVAGPHGDEHLDAAEAWVESIGKTPIRSADQRGFIVNRLLIPYLNDAVRLHESSGEDIERIDAVMTTEHSMPMGPFALIDMIGVDVTVATLESLAQVNDDPRLYPADTLRRYLAEDRLGRKSGAGFYYEGGRNGH